MGRLTRDARDKGFGITEAIVAIVLFGILAVAMVPVVILSLRISGENVTVVSAQSIARERLELATIAASGTATRNPCQAYLDFLRTAPPSTYTDTRGTTYTIIQTPSVATANTYAVSPSGSTGDANSDGVLDSFCLPTKYQSSTFSVTVVSDDPSNPNSAVVSTTIAIPRIGSQG